MDLSFALCIRIVGTELTNFLYFQADAFDAGTLLRAQGRCFLTFATGRLQSANRN